MIFISPETRTVVLSDSEDRMIVIFIPLDKTKERDRQTDGQTDRNAMAITTPRALQAMRTCCKNQHRAVAVLGTRQYFEH